MKKTILSLMLVACMLFALAACGSPSPSPTTGDDGAVAATAAPKDDTAGDDAPADSGEPVDEPATSEPFAFSLFGNITAEIKVGDEAFFNALQEQTNSIIDVQIPPSSNYDEALTIMMAGGDYPNLVLFPDQTKPVFMDGVRNGAILPVNDYIANAPNLMEFTYEVSWKTLKVLGDDQIFGVPRTSIARGDGFMIRQDWLDALEIDFVEGEPITRDQFTQILTAFTNNDPDGNGVNDTYGLGQHTPDGYLDVPEPVRFSFNLSGWQKYDEGEYEYMDPKYSKVNDAYKRAIEYTNMLWNSQLIDPDWPTLDVAAQNKRFEQGITGVRPEFVGWMPNTETGLQKVNENAKLSYMVGIVENAGDKVVGGSYSTGFWGVWSVMASTQEPQKVINVLDYMISDNFWETVVYGIEGVSWEADADGNKVAIPDQGVGGGRAILRRNNAPDFFVGLSTPVEHRERIERLIGVCIDQAVFSMDEGFRPAVMDDPAFIDAEKERKTAISKLIVGDLPMSEYDAMLDTWYQAGGELYVQQMNEGIKATK